MDSYTIFKFEQIYINSLQNADREFIPSAMTRKMFISVKIKKQTSNIFFCSLKLENLEDIAFFVNIVCDSINLPFNISH